MICRLTPGWTESLLDVVVAHFNVCSTPQVAAFNIVSSRGKGYSEPRSECRIFQTRITVELG